MTGHGRGTAEGDGITAWAEIRSVNNRFLKVNLVCSDRLIAYQSEFEALVRQHVQRGTVSIQIKSRHANGPSPVQVDVELLRSIQLQLQSLLDPAEKIPWSALLTLPGAIVESAENSEVAAEWAIVQQATLAALESLNVMRRREGIAMAADIRGHCESILQFVAQISDRAPKVVDAYTQRLTQRINQMLDQFGVSVTPADVVREVGIFAERCDISEELVRLSSHCQQFLQSIDEGGNSCGRRLDFLTQELLREANTIGSKASDAEIGRCVVEVKSVIERIREMVQNIE